MAWPDDLLRSIDKASAGCVVIVEGEVGSGKTALLGDLARQRGASLQVRGVAFDQDRPYAALLRAIRRTLTTQPPGDEAAALEADAGAERPSDVEALLHRTVDTADWPVTVDDAHLLDEASLFALARYSADTETRPVPVVAAMLPHRSSPGVAALREAAGTTIRLAPISANDAAGIVAQARPDLASSAWGDALHRFTGGRAGHVLAVATTLDERASPPEQDVLPVPPQIEQALHRALRRHGSPTRHVAVALAVLGALASVPRVAQVTGLSPADVDLSLEALGADGLLAAAPGPRLASPLIAAAVGAVAPPSVRARLARRSARVSADSGAPAGAVAGLLLDAPPHHEAWAVNVLVEAAATAERRGELRMASRCYERALAEPPGRGRRREVLTALGRVDALLGREPAANYLREAYELAIDPDERARLALDLARALATHGNDGAAAETLGQALRDEWPSSQLRHDLEAAIRALQRPAPTRAPSRWRPLPDASAAARVQAAYEAFLRGEPTTTLRRVLGAVAFGDIAPLRDEPNGLGVQHAVEILVGIEDHDAAERLLAAAEQAVGEARVTAFTGATATLRATIAAARGDLPRALDLAQQAVDVLDRTGGQQAPRARALLALVALHQDRRDVARAVLARHVEPENTVAFARFSYARGRLATAQEQWDRAREELRHAGDVGAAIGLVNPAVLPWRSALALVERRRGRPHLARELATEERSLADRFCAAGPRIVAITAAATLSEHDRAVALLAEAQELGTAATALASARAAVHHGAALRRTGARRAAITRLQDARDCAASMGARGLQRLADEELLAAGAGNTRAGTAHGTGALTPSERRVADLVATGLTNREVAGRLYVSVKAVEFHLSNVYTKLRIRSRRELPAALDAMPRGSA